MNEELDPDRAREAFEWQVGVWDRMSDVYVREIDRRFAPVSEALMARAALGAGETVLDLGCGTGAITERAASAVGSDGEVLGVDISSEMLASSRARVERCGLENVRLLEGRAEDIPAEARSCDAVLSSLALMYVVDRAAAAREIARVLKPGGRMVAAVWGPEDQCDIVRFQQTAGRFAGPPPVPGVGPGALADASPFVAALAGNGIRARVEAEVLEFEFPDFNSAWSVLSAVTTAHLPESKREEARLAVLGEMYPDGDGPRTFRNTTQFVIGKRA